jgi:copper(I)-binding protein
MRYMLAVSAVLALFTLIARDGAHAGQTGQAKPMIDIQDAWVRRASAMGNGAVYVTIRNQGSAPDALLSAATDVADRAELHETMGGSGRMMMQPLAKIDVPAGGTLEMKPGGYHIMLLGLTRDLKPGDTVTLTLRFERAGDMRIQATVR